jgi:4-hydroxybenzoate polyprenyltransferase
MLARLRTYASFVRFSHSVFALPFALAGALLASRYAPLAWSRVGWIVVCMIAARSAAMGFNRVVDAEYDARNPRTAMRELPRGRMSRGEAIAFVVVWSIVFVAAAAQLGWICLALSPIALAIVFWYSLAKRYTAHTQAFLGLAMAVAPVGGWIAAGGPARPEPWLLGLAIGSWVAGFDVLYACQDVEFDRREGLRSVPVRYGVARSIVISRLLHVSTMVALLGVGAVAGLGAIYHAGLVLVGLLLVYEQSLVRADDLSQVKTAFDLNGWVGLLYFAAIALDVYLA